MKKILSILLSVVLTASPLMAGEKANLTGLSTDLEQAFVGTTEEEIQLASEEAKDLTFKLLLYTIYVSAQMGEIAKIDDEVREKWDEIRNSLKFESSLRYSSLPALTLAGIWGIFATGWADSIKPVIRAVADASVNSSERVYTVLENLGVVKFMAERLKYSSDKVVSSYNWVAGLRVVQSVIKTNLHYSISGVASLAAVGGYVWANSQDAEEAMQIDFLRSYFGQDAAMMEEADKVVDEMKKFFVFTAAEESKLRDAFWQAVLKQAIENKFSDDPKDYNVDLAKLVLESGAASAEEVKNFTNLMQLIEKASKVKKTASDKEELVANLRTLNALAAFLMAKATDETVDNPVVLEKIRTLLGTVIPVQQSISEMTSI